MADVNKQRRSVRFMAVGDMMFCCELGEKLRKSGDYDFPFSKVKDFLEQADFLYGNLETTMTVKRQPEKFAGPGLYYADPEVAGAIARAHFHAVNLAQSHVYDYGSEAVELTMRLLCEEGVMCHGVGKDRESARQPLEVEVNGSKLGILGYCSGSTAIDKKHKYVTCPIKSGIIVEDVSKLSKRTDLVIVTFHEGLCNYPSPQYRRWAKTAVDAGAKLVVGHHPHVINGIEEYNGAVIAYGLGNFVAYFVEKKFRQTFILDCLLKSDGGIEYEAVPVWINDNFQPEIAQGHFKEELSFLIETLSSHLRTGQADKEYWAQMKKTFLGVVSRDTGRLIRAEGMTAIVRKLKSLRWHHIRLLFNAILRRP
jgi:poly-gamma-glutamate synthesis protein (capsule biosynthesis protein)